MKDIFWQWRASPGALIPARRHGCYTMTNSNGGGYYIIWCFDQIFARGGAPMIDRIWSELL